MKILHAFADYGVEAEPLRLYGEVVRLGHDPRDTNDSQPVRAKAEAAPFAPDSFDVGMFHPPCTRWSDMPDADKSGDAPNLVPLARELGNRLCDHYIIENKPRAPLDDPTLLSGKMFGLPIEHERAFETSFRVRQPPRQQSLPTESSPYFNTEKSREWWASVKGVREAPYCKHALSKNSLPAPFVHYLMRAWLEATDRADGPGDYTEYDKRKTTARRRENNQQLPVADGGH
mgnify:CR=1 FL=1